MKCGAIYVAYGDIARTEARLSIESLRQHNALPVVVVSDGHIETHGVQHVQFPVPGWGARRAKLNCDNLVPSSWDAFVYIDADTRIYQSLQPGFDILSDGWDIAITPSENQEDDFLWHVEDEEFKVTKEELGVCLQLQGGLFFVQRNEATAAFFSAWRREWEKYRKVDQGALLRALHSSPVKVWLLGRPWNGGVVVGHRFGMCRPDADKFAGVKLQEEASGIQERSSTRLG